MRSASAWPRQGASS